MTSPATAAPTWPSPIRLRRQTPGTCRCCWATATARSSPRSPTRWGQYPTPSWRATSPATAASTWPWPTTTTPTRHRVGAAGQRRRHVPAPGHLRGGVRTRTPSWRATSTATAALDLAVANYRLERRVGAAGQRRRHVPAPGHLRGGDGPDAIVAGDFNGDGRTDLAVANTATARVDAAGQRRRHVPAPGHLRGGGRARRDRGGRLQRRRPARPGRRQLRPTTCRCCWATATARSSTRSTERGRGQSPRDRGGRLQRRRPHRPGRRKLRLDNDVSVLLGNGDGTFQPQVTYAVGSDPIAIVAGDFNGDGRTDLAVANDGSTTTSRCCWATATARSSPRSPTRSGTDPIASWRATSTATAAPTWPSSTRTTTTPCRCCWATATARSSPRSPTRWGPTRTRSWRATSTATAAPTWPSPTTARNDVSVLLGNGDGTFQPQVTYAVGS